ncbi:unnamed protein product, partial [Heterotrigona itama]
MLTYLNKNKCSYYEFTLLNRMSYTHIFTNMFLHFSEGGFFKAHLQFPKEYPLRPPRMKFITEIWHPNIEKNGNVCISILHEPGDDKWGYEKASERWLPVHTVETILISVISMLADPNDESPANVDAA